MPEYGASYFVIIEVLNVKHTRFIGIILLIAFALSQGLRDVYLSSAFGALGFFDLVFLAFATATIFFTILLLIWVPEDIKRLKKQWRGVVAVNVTTAGAWLCYFGALNLLEPSVVNTIFSGVAPVSVVLLASIGLYATDRAKALTLERIIHLGVLFTLLFLGWIVLSGRSGFANISVNNAAGGILMAALSGIIITAETVYAKRMNEAGVSAIGVLAFRFVFIALIGASAILINDTSQIPAMPLPALLMVSGKMLVLMVAPLLLVGQGLAMTSPLTTGIVAAFGPAIVFMLQAGEGRIPSSGWVLLATAIYVSLTLLGVLVRAFSLSRKTV